MEAANSITTHQSVEERRAAAAAPSPFRRIVACIDAVATSGDAIMQHAAGAAEAFAVPLTILHVLEPDSSHEAVPTDPLDWDVRRCEARAHLDRLLGLARQHAIDAESQLLQGRAAEHICQWAWGHNADLIVLASHGEHGRSLWTLSSTARKLVEGAPGSLLLVPADGVLAPGEAVRYGRIMVPLDGSSRAESVLPMASRLALAHGADMLIVHVPPIPELTRVGPLSAQDLELEQQTIARNERVMRAYLEQIRARTMQAGIAVRTLVTRAGDPRSRLVRLARREGIDLIVLSAYGRRGPRDAPCGSVTAHLLTNAVTPMLVFRERPRRVLRRFSGAAEHAVAPRPPVQAVA